MKNKSKIIVGSILGTLIIFGLILVANINSNSVNAETLISDNKLTYLNNDLTVNFKDKDDNDLGVIELKSHSSVTEVNKFGFGKEEVVMYYDFTNWNFTENGLGDIKFTDMNTDKEIQKDYSFVIWEEIEYDVNDFEEVCNLSLNETNECFNELVGTHKENKFDWVEYNSLDIPEGDSRIGLKTYVGKDDYIDGIWTIAGKEVDKHAEWTAGLNVGLEIYYKFDEESGTNIEDSIGNQDGTLSNNVDVNIAGKIGKAINFTATEVAGGNSGGEIVFTGYANAGTEYTMSFWLLPTMKITGENVIYENVGGAWVIQSAGNSNDTVRETGITFETVNAYGSWINYVFVSNTTGWFLFKNGAKSGFTIRATNSDISGVQWLGRRPNGWDSYSGLMDEFGLWERSLSQAEITQLYNGGDGITFETGPQFNITGTIKYSNGTGVNAAIILATNETIAGANYSTTSDSAGDWVIEDIVNSTYTITGYEPTNASIDGDVEAHVVV